MSEKFGNQPKTTKVKKIERSGEMTAPKHIFKIVWSPEGRERGCIVKPEEKVELKVGDIVQYENTLDVDAILPGGECAELWDEQLPLVIGPGESVNLTRSAGAISGKEYLCTAECDGSGGGPRFVPQP